MKTSHRTLLAALLATAACSSSSHGNAPVCVTSAALSCPNGEAVEACVTTGADGACATTYYEVGAKTFECVSCSDCTLAVESVLQSCGGTPGFDAGAKSDAAASDAASSDGGGTGFVGTWTVIGGSGMYTCPDSTDGWPNPATIYIVGGASAGDLTSSNPDENACTLQWKSAGTMATLLSGTCSFYQTLVTGGTATLDPTGTLTWSLTATTPDPVCSATETITAVRK